jgi:hypothetical protein
MPSFNGVNIFGRSVQITTANNPRDEQVIAAPGSNGVAAMDLGSRGKVTTVSGVLVGINAAALNLAMGYFRTFDDGQPYVLEDSFGNLWPYVKLRRFVPGRKVKFDPLHGYCVEYEAEFQHLV